MNNLRLSNYLRWSLEGIVIFLVFGIFSAKSSIVHLSVELIGVIVSWIVFILTQNLPPSPHKKLLSFIGVSSACTGSLLIFTLFLQLNALIQGEIQNEIHLNSSDMFLQGIFIFFTLLFYQYTGRIIFAFCVNLLIVLFFLFGIASNIYFICNVCQEFYASGFLPYSILFLAIPTILLIHKNKYLFSPPTALLLELSILMISVSVVISIIFPFGKNPHAIWTDLGMLFSWYFLFKSIISKENLIYISNSSAQQLSTENLNRAQERVEELDALRTNLTQILSEHDSERLLDAILIHAISLLHAEGGEIGFLDTKRDEIRIVASKNSISCKGALIPAGIGILGMTITRKEPALMHNGLFSSDTVLEKKIRTCISSPLIAENMIIGAVMLIRNDHHNAFSSEDLNLLSLFSQQAAIALRNTKLLEDAQKRAETDSLTLLVNHRHFFELASNEFSRSLRYHHPLSALMFDIDHFKDVNDTYGHNFGDKVLVSIATLCTQLFRSIDVIGRYGGEEFAVLLPETPLNVAKEVGERLRRSVAEMIISEDSTSISVTISMGIASYQSGCPSINTLIVQADEALYSAKNSGRNKLVVWNEQVHSMFLRKQRMVSYQHRLKSYRKDEKNPHL